MAKDNIRKIKLLKILELLRHNTDESHPLSTNQIVEELACMGIPCDRRTVSQDIVTLNDLGYEIMSTMIKHDKCYYVEDRSFSVPELKILIDAVHASNFITEKKSEELIAKIAALAGSHRGEVLKHNMVYFNTRKHSNEKILYSVDTLEEAILTQRKVIFLYFDLNEKGERVYRRDGHHYVVEPVALIFNEDNYYLMVYSAKHNGTANYRVDRMEAVEMIDEQITDSALLLRDSIGNYTEQAFKMYGGEPVDITIRFDTKLIGVVYDKFGEDTKMIRLAENTYEATVKVQISPTFWGWIFQFGKQMEITSPKEVIEEYKTRAAMITD